MDYRGVNTVPLIFTTDELWFLQSLVRHEMAQQDTWKYPPVSLELNDQVADVLLACHEFELKEGTLVLTRGDLLLLDYVVPQSATNVAGKNIGHPILLKTYQARRLLAEGSLGAASEPDETDAVVRLERWREAGMPKHPRRSRKLKEE